MTPLTPAPYVGLTGAGGPKLIPPQAAYFHDLLPPPGPRAQAQGLYAGLIARSPYRPSGGARGRQPDRLSNEQLGGSPARPQHDLCFAGADSEV